jgi:hypothetical protein
VSAGHAAGDEGGSVVSPEGNGVPLTGPGNGADGAGWFNWIAATTTSSASSTTSVINVGRRIGAAG